MKDTGNKRIDIAYNAAGREAGFAALASIPHGIASEWQIEGVDVCVDSL